MRLRAWAVALAALCATLAPIVRSTDGFPLSNYPMFLQVRPDVTTFDLAVAVSSDGTEHRLSPQLVGGSVEVIQAVAVVEDAVAKGTTSELCTRIAARVAAADEESATVSVTVVTETYDIVPALAEDAPPVGRTVHATCQIVR